jgi:hypothetical protein
MNSMNSKNYVHTEQEPAYFWLAVGVLCSGAATLHTRIVDAR